VTTNCAVHAAHHIRPPDDHRGANKPDLNRYFKELIMINAKSLVAATLAALSFSALADGGDVQPFMSGSSTLTRAEVRADLASAIAAGAIAQGEQGHAWAPRASERSRAEVVAELMEAQRLGLTQVTEAGAPVATAEQLQLIRRAGERAATMIADMPS
jgi:alpha-D-ribose 1-methylphosphonate 5-triphosphate synthase subunit PhnG